MHLAYVSGGCVIFGRAAELHGVFFVGVPTAETGEKPPGAPCVCAIGQGQDAGVLQEQGEDRKGDPESWIRGMELLPNYGELQALYNNAKKVQPGPTICVRRLPGKVFKIRIFNSRLCGMLQWPCFPCRSMPGSTR